jgi:hypothetical protein
MYPEPLNQDAFHSAFSTAFDTLNSLEIFAEALKVVANEESTERQLLRGRALCSREKWSARRQREKDPLSDMASCQAASA